MENAAFGAAAAGPADFFPGETDSLRAAFEAADQNTYNDKSERKCPGTWTRQPGRRKQYA
jgi:hypothetical protein